MASLRSALSRRRRDEIELALAEPDPVRHRRRVVVAVTLVLDAVLLALSLRIQPGDAAFYPATFGLAVILLGGAWLARPKLRHDLGEEARPGPQVVTGLVVGAVLLVVFLVGAVVVAQVPSQSGPVRQLLAHATEGSLPIVLAITVVNGFAEEAFYRGALYDATFGRLAIPLTTVLYTVVTALSGIPLLALAAFALGVVAAVLRRLTRGILAPIAAHLVWSVGMLLLLGPTLDLLEKA